MALLHNRTRGTVAATNVRAATAPWERTVGFLTRQTVDAGEGLWFARCGAVHTIGMRVRIDIVFLDAHSRILKIIARAPSWRLYGGGLRARHVIELAPGAASRAGLAVGDDLVLR